MDAGTEVAGGKRKRAKGRKEEGQEKVIKTGPVKEKIEELVRLYKAQCDSAEAFSEGVKSAAESAGINTAPLRKFVVARAGEKFLDKKRDCEQLSLLFDEVGE